VRELTAIVENENQALSATDERSAPDKKSAAVDKQKDDAKTYLELEQLMDFEFRYQRHHCPWVYGKPFGKQKG